MKLVPEQLDDDSLLGFGREVVSLLEKGDFGALADSFGCALAFGRDPAVAVETDLQSCLSEFSALAELGPAVPPSMVAKYFKPNRANLIAVVECVFHTSAGCPILAELVVSSSG